MVGNNVDAFIQYIPTSVNYYLNKFGSKLKSLNINKTIKNRFYTVTWDDTVNNPMWVKLGNAQLIVIKTYA